MIKVLLVRDYKSSCNVPYLVYCTYWLKRLFLIDFTEVSLHDYVTFNQDSYDIVIYSPPPGKKSRNFLRNLSVINRTDEKFLNFKKNKILFDTHDHGNYDGFPRFESLAPEIVTSLPRIKNAPHKEYLQKYNVVWTTTYPIGLNPRSPAYNYFGGFAISQKKVERNIDISYRVKITLNRNSYRQEMREATLNIIKNYQGSSYIDTEYKENDPKYKAYLSRVLISVCPPGHGPGTFRHLESLNAQTLMLSHDSIDGIKLLPNSDLVEGEDYISFDFDNLTNKLDMLLANREKVAWIAKNGQKKFTKGYSVWASTWELYKLLSQFA